jgi:hypothetical protein
LFVAAVLNCNPQITLIPQIAKNPGGQGTLGSHSDVPPGLIYLRNLRMLVLRIYSQVIEDKRIQIRGLLKRLRGAAGAVT